MCGIVGYIGTKRAVPVLINGLISLEYRGYDSAGIAVLNDKKAIDIVKNVGRVDGLSDKVNKLDISGTVGIAHTRWATHGIPSEENAHPHFDNSKQFAVVHNGIIENYDKLRKFLTKHGYKLYSDTDTEVIPNLIHYYYNELSASKDNNLFLRAVSKATMDLEGSYAIEVISPLYPDEIIVCKKDSPMVVGVGKNENYIGSDVTAVLKYTKQFYFMEDNEMAVITKDNISFYTTSLENIKKEIKDIEWDQKANSKNGYDDFMLKEIFEQPTAIQETIGTALNDKSKISLPLDDIDFTKFNKIYIIACGTAMHAGIASKYVFERYTNIPVEIDMASEFRYRKPLINDKTLCIFISQSGETADTLAALKLSKAKKATSISIVNMLGSSITRVSDYVLYTHAGPEIAVASTKAYTCQVTLLTLLALYMAEKLASHNKLDSKLVNEIKHLKAEIAGLPAKLKEVLKLSDTMKEVAKKIYKKPDVFFIGRINDYAVAMEASLKLKEISYIHSDAYAAGELKHGPIALMEKGVDVIGIATNKSILPKTISNLEEVVTRGANVYLVTNQDMPNGVFDNIIKIPEISTYLSPILSIVPLQFLAYYIAKDKGLDVDKPRNLAKSVTVE